MKGPTPILFLDLDGTVRLGPKQRDGKEIKDPTEVEVFPGTVERLQLYKERGWRIAAVANVGAIALGTLTDSTNARIMQETSRLCANLFDRIVWCPHDPEAKGETEEETLMLSRCMCRKPKPKLLFDVMYSLSEQYRDDYYSPDKCLIVGDFNTDGAMASFLEVPYMTPEKWRAGEHRL